MKTKTKKVTKVTKVTKDTKVVMDYKGMYESMKVLADNLADELTYKSDLAFDRFAKIQKLEDKLETFVYYSILTGLVTLVIGIAVGYYI